VPTNRENGPPSLRLRRRAFSALALAAVAEPWSWTPRPSDARAQFLRDVVRSYELQIVGVDLEDVHAVLQRAHSPVLAVGFAAGGDRASTAAKIAMVRAARLGKHSLIVIAAAPGEGRLKEYSRAYQTVRSHAEPDGCLIYAPCDDPGLPAGVMRVAVLTG
jgi:cell division GTPase FtsZ